MYTEASNVKSFTTARLQTEPAIRHNNNRVCVRFWYHMYGDSMGVLSVIYMEGGRRDRSVWTRNGKALFSGITCTGIPWEFCLLSTWRGEGETGVSGHGMVRLYFLVSHVRGFHGSSVCYLHGGGKERQECLDTEW